MRPKATAAAQAGPVSGTARDRLLSAANELFYTHGVQTVGIDRIIERAGVAKASLYNLFGSKEELVRAYLDARHEQTIERLTAAIDGVDDPRQKILAIFDSQFAAMDRPGYRGCAFASASTEAADDGLIARATASYRADILALLTDLARAAGARDPVMLGRQLQVVYDGAAQGGRLDQGPVVARAARAAVEALVNAAT